MRMPSIGARARLQLSALFLAVSVSHAAATSDRLKAPAAAEQKNIKAELSGYFSVYEKKRAESSSALIRNSAARQSWTDQARRILLGRSEALSSMATAG